MVVEVAVRCFSRRVGGYFLASFHVLCAHFCCLILGAAKIVYSERKPCQSVRFYILYVLKCKFEAVGIVQHGKFLSETVELC